MQDFLNSINSFVELLRARDNCNLFELPSLHCTTAENQSDLELHCYDTRMREEWDGFVVGVVKSAAKTLFGVGVTLEMVENEDIYIEARPDNHVVFKIRKSSGNHCITNFKTLQYKKTDHSTSPADLKMSVPTLCSAFPFLLIFDENLQIQQLGLTLIRLIGRSSLAKDKHFNRFFEILAPKVRLTFSSILCRKNGAFLLRLKIGNSGSVGDNLKPGAVEMRGQMIYLPESDCILFLGSPRVENIEQLQGRGLFLSDIPRYDATKGLVLVSEQAVAQNCLKKKTEQLKRELQEASQELAREKHKTEDLLESIFPRDVAEKLIHRQPVPARFINDVTILFSDIVGFTSICGKCAPMDVVEMLKTLYTEFDRKCGQLDLCKVRSPMNCFHLCFVIYSSEY